MLAPTRMTANKKSNGFRKRVFWIVEEKKYDLQLWISSLHFGTLLLHALMLLNGRDFLAVVKAGVDLISKQ